MEKFDHVLASPAGYGARSEFVGLSELIHNVSRLTTFFGQRDFMDITNPQTTPLPTPSPDPPPPGDIGGIVRKNR
jgi:hypothetical protein